MKDTKPTYQLARDDFGHWHVIPSDKAAAWNKWLDTAAARKDKYPEWAVSVGTWSKVKFKAYTVE